MIVLQFMAQCKYVDKTVLMKKIKSVANFIWKNAEEMFS